MPSTPTFTHLLLAAIDGQDADLSAFTDHAINDGLAALVKQGYAYGNPARRVGDPTAYYSARGLRLTPMGERKLKSFGPT